MIDQKVQQRALDELRGDLDAIASMRTILARPFGDCPGGMSFAGKRKLATACSRLITGIEKRLNGGTLRDPNTIESILARTLIELGSRQEEQEV